jgi:hypothetical protein
MRNRGTKDRNSGIEPQTLGQLIGVRGQRKKDGRQGTDHVRHNTEDVRLGTEM